MTQQQEYPPLAGVVGPDELPHEDVLWAVMADARLPLTTRTVLVSLLLNFTDRTTGRCAPGHAAIAKATALSEHAVRRAIRRLQAAGYLTRSWAGRGRGHAVAYSFAAARVYNLDTGSRT